LLCSEETVNFPFPKPDKSSQRHPIQFPHDQTLQYTFKLRLILSSVISDHDYRDSSHYTFKTLVSFFVA